MSKNVLILSASPRKAGNSDVLCDQFLTGAEDAGHNAEKIFLKDKHINYCTGCGACAASGRENPCSQKDDMTEILDKMIKADVIVMATPVYFYSMNGQMKTLIDRTCAEYTKIAGKDFYFIMTAADGEKKAMDGTLTAFRGFTSCLPDPIEKGIIKATGVWNKNEIKNTPYMNEAYEMGKNI